MLLDVERDYALLEREDRTMDGRLIARYRNEEFRHCVEPGVWLPTRCTASFFTPPRTFDTFEEMPVQEVVMELKKVGFGRRKTKFTLLEAEKYSQPGTMVFGDQVTRISADGLEVPVILTVGADEEVLRRAVEIGRGTENTTYIIILFGVLLGTPIALAVWKRVRKG